MHGVQVLRGKVVLVLFFGIQARRIVGNYMIFCLHLCSSGLSRWVLHAFVFVAVVVVVVVVARIPPLFLLSAFLVLSIIVG